MVAEIIRTSCFVVMAATLACGSYVAMFLS